MTGMFVTNSWSPPPVIIRLATYGGRAFTPAHRTGTHFLPISPTIVFHSKLSNATLKPFYSFPVSTCSTFEVLIQKYKSAVILLLLLLLLLLLISAVQCGHDKQVERQSQTEGEKRDFLQRIADREEALHQANVSSQPCAL